MEHDWFNPSVGSPASDRADMLVRDALVAAGSLGAADWLMRPINAWAQDLATPVADPGSAGEIGRPETVPIEHLVVIFLENRPFDHLYGLFPGKWAPFAGGAHPPDECKRCSVRHATADRELLGEPSRRRHSLPIRSAERAVPDRGLRAVGRHRSFANPSLLPAPAAGQWRSYGPVRRLE